MQILHVNKYVYRRGGAEAYMLDVARLQEGRGHSVSFWGMQHPENPIDDRFRAPLDSLIDLDPFPRGAGAARAAARMVWSRSSAAAFSAALRSSRPDVIHAHNVYHQLSPSILAVAKDAGIPVVMTLHDYKLACPSYQLLAGGELCQACVGHTTLHAVAKRCKSGSLPASAILALESGAHRLTKAYAPVGLFISPSRFLADVMRRSGINEDRLRVIPHFIEDDAPNLASAPGEVGGIDAAVPTPEPTAPTAGVLFAGRLSHEKGVDTLVEAAALVPDVPVTIAGDGPLAESLRDLAHTRGAANVRFLGLQTRAQVAALRERSIATAVPSRWHENQPMTILESYSAGVPVIATRLGGMPELVEQGRTGYLVPHNDPQALADAIRAAAADPEGARALGANGRDRLLEVHEPNRHLDALDEAYARVLRTTAVSR